MNITPEKIKEKVRFLKKEQERTGEENILLEKMSEAADLVGITVRCDGKDHFHVMAGCIHGLHDCCLIGMIPENHSPDNDEIQTLLWLMSNRRIENKQIMILRGNDEPTRIMVRIDQEILDDLINWFTIMFTVCGLLVDESFFQL